jgi:hypothetical protein
MNDIQPNITGGSDLNAYQRPVSGPIQPHSLMMYEFISNW